MTGGETGIDQISMPEMQLADPAEEIPLWSKAQY
jgi:hypothetical protein